MEPEFTSIIIPTYNRSGLIQRAIESVINQTVADWELIVVDDGSTDDTKAIVSKYLNKKVRYIYQSNAGANKARNVGAMMAKYSYLTFLDSDDELFTNWLESFREKYEGKSAVICCGTLRIESDRERESMPKPLGKVFSNIVGKFTNGACYAIQRDLFFEVGGFDELLRSGQHTELSFRLADRIVSGHIIIKVINKPLVKIHIHDGPRIRNSSESKLRGALHMLKKHEELMKRFPRLKMNYSKIATYQSFRQGHFLIAIKSFFTYCKSVINVKIRNE